MTPKFKMTLPQVVFIRLLLILPLFLLLSTFSVKAQKIDSLFLDAAINKLQNAKAYTLKIADLMPDDKYVFMPTPEEMKFGEQLLHISSNLGWLSSSYLSTSINPVTSADMEMKKKGEIILVLNKAYDFALDVLRHFALSQLSDTVSFFAGHKTKLQIINLLMDHQTHHRGQLLVYLRLNKITPPGLYWVVIILSISWSKV